MTPRTSGLQRDVQIIRHRAWLFLPFLALGIIVAVVFSRVGGNTTASATMQLQTAVSDVVSGASGFEIYQAQAMTRLPQFRQEVLQAIGDKSFDYSRFNIVLNPNVASGGVSSGNLVVTISDSQVANAQKYVSDFVTVFTREFTSATGLFRTMYVQQQQAVATAAEEQYTQAYQRLQTLASQAGVTVPASQLVSGSSQSTPYSTELAQKRADLAAQQTEIQSALASLAGASPGTAAGVASSILQEPVTAADAMSTLQAASATLSSAIKTIDAELGTASGSALPTDVRAQLDKVLALGAMRNAAATYVANAEITVNSALSTVDASYTTSGGHLNSKLGLAAIALGITVVFGLIAIYLIEWLSQLRESEQDVRAPGPTADANR